MESKADWVTLTNHFDKSRVQLILRKIANTIIEKDGIVIFDRISKEYFNFVVAEIKGTEYAFASLGYPCGKYDIYGDINEFYVGDDQYKKEVLFWENERKKFANWLDSVANSLAANLPDTAAQNKSTKQIAEPQQSTLPKELDNDEAAKYFAKAIEIGLMDESYNWSKGMQLLSCFAREMSLKLGLSKAQNSDGTQRISWLPFEQLFKIDKSKIRANYNDIQKTGQNPHGIELIDKIFE